ncbi:MAG: phosphoglucosamine mutase [Leptospirales bacterium]|nr:phosphoglucosamine mutase [Leptospirales bacterium]
MKSPLMKSVSGIRGIVGESFTPELLVSAASAFSRYVNYGTVVIGRDSRPTGEAVSMNIISSLLLAGCNVIDIGIVPTPTVEIMVKELKAAGGIVISASHNPIEWNALKFINSSGTFLTSKEIIRLFKLMDSPSAFKKWDRVGKLTKNHSAEDIHIKKVLDCININKIQNKKIHVVLDSVNGAGSLITPKLLDRLNCKVTTINCKPDGMFPRGAEPLPENLSQLSEAVIKNRADIGFAQDPDADRLAIVDEKGKPIGEEYTIALVTEHILSKKKKKKENVKESVVVNLSTTKAVEDIALKFNVSFFRAKVGEINVVEEMKKRGAIIGGEGNGGVISPEIHSGRDSLAGIGYILEMISDRDKKLSDIVNELPDYYMKKGKVSLKQGIDIDSVLADIKRQFKDEKISDIDGLRIDFNKHPEFKNGWVHLRSSNTEPVFRIIAESPSVKETELIYSFFAGILK